MCFKNKKNKQRRSCRGRVHFVVGPVVAWSCLYLVKLCGTHLTSAFSVSGIHCCNYAIMSLYSRVRLYTPTHPRSCNMPQLDFFFFFFLSFFGPDVLLVFSPFYVARRSAALDPNLIFYFFRYVACVWTGFWGHSGRAEGHCGFLL